MAEDRKEYFKEYRLKNKDKIKEYKLKNKDKINIQRRKYSQTESAKESKRKSDKKFYENNKKDIMKRNHEYHSQRMLTNPLVKLKKTLRSRAYSALVNQGYKKTTKTFRLLGATWDDVSEYIEEQFIEGMTWSNHGDWHIDHIIPLASAKTKEELVSLFHYKNLQPLWAEDNLKKGDKF